MKERIRTLMTALNFNAGQFADEIGIQKSGMSHILTGRNNPSLDFIQKLLERFPDVNLEWLIMGKGSIYKDSKGEFQGHKEADSKPFEIEPDLFSGINRNEITDNQYVTAKISESKPVENPLKRNEPEPNKDQSKEISSNPEDRHPGEGVPVGMEKSVHRIVFFYSDNTFSEFFPQQKQ
jgi:transcriptional regulator with XRE-family HTH domain